MKRILLALLALCCVVSSPPVEAQTTKSMTVSNTLILNRSARRVVTTATVPTRWPRPIHWKVVMGGKVRAEVTDKGAAPYVLIDTIWEPVPVATSYRVVAYSGTKRDSVFRTISVQRSMTTAELAHQDSFPNCKILICGKYQHRIDSVTKKVLDSLPITMKGDTIQLFVGYSARLGLFAKNRYSGKVIILQGDPVLCESARREFESLKSAGIVPLPEVVRPRLWASAGP
jgi:hypothetical protein